MMHVKTGQPVNLSIKHIKTPSTIPQRKHVISVSYSLWLVTYKSVSKILYTCSRDSCQPGSNSSDVNYTRYSVTAKCLNITDVKEDEFYVLKEYFIPISPHGSNISFYLKYDGECSF